MKDESGKRESVSAAMKPIADSRPPKSKEVDAPLPAFYTSTAMAKKFHLVFCPVTLSHSQG
jgi:hypothetical protein